MCVTHTTQHTPTNTQVRALNADMSAVENMSGPPAYQRPIESGQLAQHAVDQITLFWPIDNKDHLLQYIYMLLYTYVIISLIK